MFARLFFYLLFVAPILSLRAADPVWTTPQGEVRGKLIQVVGPYAVISRGDLAQFITTDAMTDEQIARVAKFIAKENEPGKWSASNRQLSYVLKRRLNQLENGKLVSLELGERKEPRFYLIYFSAGWCGPCHRFTPSLVNAYKAMKEKVGDAVELVFVSWDENRTEQVKYANQYAMPWTIMNFLDARNTSAVSRFAGKGIPCLALLTNTGELLFHSYRGEEYLGPQHVLDSMAPLVELLRPETKHDGGHPVAMRKYISENASQDTPAKPYYVALEKSRFGGIRMAGFDLSLSVDATGRVTDYAFADDGPRVLDQLIREQVDQWRFFPAMEGGRPVSSKTVIRVKL